MSFFNLPYFLALLLLKIFALFIKIIHLALHSLFLLFQRYLKLVDFFSSLAWYVLRLIFKNVRFNGLLFNLHWGLSCQATSHTLVVIITTKEDCTVGVRSIAGQICTLFFIWINCSSGNRIFRRGFWSWSCWTIP